MQKELSLDFTESILRNPDQGAALEWLQTNSAGDMACGTLIGPNTRREHGMFTLSDGPGGKPMLLLGGLDVTLLKDAESFALSCHDYVGVRAPRSYLLLRRFNATPLPEWTYEVAGSLIRVRLFLPDDSRCVVIRWHLADSAPAGDWRLRVRPLFAYRDLNSLTRANDQAQMKLQRDGDCSTLAPYQSCPECHLLHPGASVTEEGCWYYRFDHACDRAAGRPSTEDFFSPCEFTYSMKPGTCADLIVGPQLAAQGAGELERVEIQRRSGLALPGLETDSAGGILAHAASQFTAREADLKTGWPAAKENLRETLIAFPGIFLCARKLAQARRFLENAAAEAAASRGDERLWFFRAAELYVDHARDWPFLKETIAPACERLVEPWLERNADASVTMDSDGLLICRETGLTWMDTLPRIGKPVEVNALWHHILMLLTRWAGRRGDMDKARRYATIRDLCARSFKHRFWNSADNALFDMVDGINGNDAAIRPNQLFALALPSDLLDRSQALAVLSVVERKLLTPRGLRSLSLDDKSFQTLSAGAENLETARHAGAAYVWLIGPYVDAVFRAHGRVSRAYSRAEACLEPILTEHLREVCVGQVSEIFDGAYPHAPHGAFAHAMSTGELIRACMEIRGKLW